MREVTDGTGETGKTSGERAERLAQVEKLFAAVNPK